MKWKKSSMNTPVMLGIFAARARAASRSFSEVVPPAPATDHMIFFRSRNCAA